MKKLALLILLLIPISHCGPNQTTFDHGTVNCTTQQIAPGTPLALGGAMISCPDGTTSLISNGTIITPIQFCPGSPNYPNSFPEVGFKFGTSIYAVYSANDGFMTLIPPGLYQSNAIGSNCTFTVNPNGTITN